MHNYTDGISCILWIVKLMVLAVYYA